MLHQREAVVVSSNQQRVVWEFISELTDLSIAESNKIGPYETSEDQEVERYGGCSGYRACLDFAAKKKWGGFTCSGCYRFEALQERKRRK